MPWGDVMGVDTLIWVHNEFGVLNCYRRYCFSNEHFRWYLLYEVNNIGEAEAISIVLDRKYLFKPIKSYEYSSHNGFGFLRLAMVYIPLYYKLLPLEKQLVLADRGELEFDKFILMKGRRLDCPFEGCWWSWINDFIYIIRYYTVIEKHNVLYVHVDYIEYNGTRITLDHERSHYGRKWYHIVEPVYNVDIPGEPDDYWISSYVYPVLKFLKTNYPIYIRLKSKRKTNR